MVDILVSDLVPLRQRATYFRGIWYHGGTRDGLGLCARGFLAVDFLDLSAVQCNCPGGSALISWIASDRDNCDREAPSSGLFGLNIVRHFIDLGLNRYLLGWFSISGDSFRTLRPLITGLAGLAAFCVWEGYFATIP
jgi:hypothetical protein